MDVITANYPVIMWRKHWRNVPEYAAPPKYFLRRYKPGDVTNWVRIMRAAFLEESLKASF